MSRDRIGVTSGPIFTLAKFTHLIMKGMIKEKYLTRKEEQPRTCWYRSAGVAGNHLLLFLSNYLKGVLTCLKRSSTS